MNWLERQLVGVASGARPVVVIDPELAATEAALVELGTVLPCGDWYGLWRAFEHQLRGTGYKNRPVLWITDPEVGQGSDLPWSVEQASDVAVVSWPVDDAWRDVISGADDEMADRIIATVRRAGAGRAAGAVLREVFGVALPTTDPAAEFDVVARLRTDPSIPPALWRHVHFLTSTPLTSALANEPPDWDSLSAAWVDWLAHGAASRWAATLAGARFGVSLLAIAGLLPGAPVTGSGLPTWVRIGAADADPAALATQLLAERPEPWPPVTATDWFGVASWWGEIRSVVSDGGPKSEIAVSQARSTWDEIDSLFNPWLRRELGTVMTRQGPLPLAVHQIAPFLARRLRRDGSTPVLLVVLDGMAFAQWALLRRACRLDVVEAGACFAMCPTLTSVSRQAIFAGTWPADFAESLWTTSHEARRWTAFWAAQGLDRDDVAWARTEGRNPGEIPSFGGATVAGLVVNAVDELMHGAEMLGDAQVAAGVNLWSSYGFLEELVRQAHHDGRTIWITADHGNVEAAATGKVVEGLRVETAGTRVRVYASSALRDAARADGIVWDPPGMPPPGRAMLFAPGRGGFHSGGPRVTHGGLSLDEVIVPFVRVVPQMDDTTG